MHIALYNHLHSMVGWLLQEDLAFQYRIKPVIIREFFSPFISGTKDTALIVSKCKKCTQKILSVFTKTRALQLTLYRTICSVHSVCDFEFRIRLNTSLNRTVQNNILLTSKTKSFEKSTVYSEPASSWEMFISPSPLFE